VHEEADDQAAEHPQNQEAFGGAHAAAIIIEGDIQAQVAGVLDAPALAIGLEPGLGGQFLLGKVGDQSDRFIFAPGVLPG
jgi:hypothetical protein